MPPSESCNIFIPTDRERQALLELIQSPQESLESIANELKITLSALTVYLASDDAIPLLAQAELANARRARIAASAQLEQCVGALSLIINDFISDVTHNLQRETPKSRREQDRQKETTRRAATLLYRIANFTPKILMVPPPPQSPQSTKANPSRERGVTQTPLSPTPHANQSSPSPPASKNPTREPGAAIAPTSPHPNGIKKLPTRHTSPSPERQRAGASAFTSDIPHPKSDIAPPRAPP